MNRGPKTWYSTAYVFITLPDDTIGEKTDHNDIVTQAFFGRDSQIYELRTDS